MTKEEIDLLLIDLCARLPYKIKCNVWLGHKCPAINEKDKYIDDILETINPKTKNCTFHNIIGYDFGFFPITYIKPYLRPMSSMTEEEIDEYDSELDKDLDIVMDGALDNDRHITSDGKHNFSKNFVTHFGNDWLNKHHFDYRGLISMGIAIEASEDMYKNE